MKFDCPTCQQTRHVTDDHRDPRADHCWYCGALVPWTGEDLARFAEEIDPAYGKPLTVEEREHYEARSRAASELKLDRETFERAALEAEARLN